MGMSPFRSCMLTPPGSPERLPNPNPARFEILRAVTIGPALIVEVHYPDCINYEGRKILLFAEMTVDELRAKKTLDPHFTPGGGPVARFEPTSVGWELAVRCATDILRTTSDSSRCVSSAPHRWEPFGDELQRDFVGMWICTRCGLRRTPTIGYRR